MAEICESESLLKNKKATVSVLSSSRSVPLVSQQISRFHNNTNSNAIKVVAASSSGSNGSANYSNPNVRLSVGQLRPAFSYQPVKQQLTKKALPQLGSKTVVIRTLACSTISSATVNSDSANGLQTVSKINKFPNGTAVVFSKPIDHSVQKNSQQNQAESSMQARHTNASVYTFKPVHSGVQNIPSVSLLSSNRNIFKVPSDLRQTSNIVKTLGDNPVITVKKLSNSNEVVVTEKSAGSFTRTVLMPVRNDDQPDKVVSYTTEGAGSSAVRNKSLHGTEITSVAETKTAAANDENNLLELDDTTLPTLVAAEEIIVDDQVSLSSMIDNISSATTFIQNSIRPSKIDDINSSKSGEARLFTSSSLVSGDRRNIIVVSNDNSSDGSKDVDNYETPEEAKRKAALRPVLTFEGINDILDSVSFSHLTGSQMKCITYASCTMGHQVPPGLLLDVDTVDGIVLEEANVEMKTWYPRVLFSDSFVLHSEQLLDENRFKVVPFQINANKLKREVLSKQQVSKGEKRSIGTASVASNAKKCRTETAIKLPANDKNGCVIESETIDSEKIDNSEMNADQTHENNCESNNDNAFYGCYMCNFTGKEENDIVKHWIKEHIPEKPYVCCYCFAVFSQSYKAQLHIEKFHAGREVAIALKPSKVFTTQMVVTTDAFDPDVPVIPFDGNTTKVPTLLLDGETELPTIDGGFSCKKCDFTCLSAFDLKKHLRQEHSCLRPYVCYVCGRRFSCSYDVRRHVEQFHASQTEKRKSSNDNVDLNSSTRLESVLIDNKTPTLTQKAAWSVFLEKSGLAFSCKFCDFRTDDKSVIWDHAMEKHAWPTSIRCSRCRSSVDVGNENRSQKFVSCWNCKLLISIGPSSTNPIFPAGKVRKSRGVENSGRVYVCKVCDYKTNDKSGMTRHIKYNHTACRPYSCPYCNYSAVERPKVRVHISGHHRGLPITVVKRLEVIKQFQATIATLYKKLTFVIDGSSQEMMDLYEGDGDLGDDGLNLFASDQEDALENDNTTKKFDGRSPSSSLGKRASHRRIEAYNAQWRGGPSMLQIDFNMTPDGRLQCEECDYVTNQWGNLARHMRLSHKEIYEKGYKQKTRTRKAFQCEHFRCLMCDYRCLDRSCMARHVKYLHMNERPHKCPHCNYKNVEKTKVRLHIKTMHAGKNPSVKTNQEVLLRMSDEVRKYFVRIDRNGDEMPDTASAGGQPIDDDGDSDFVCNVIKTEEDVSDKPSVTSIASTHQYGTRSRRRHAVPEYMVLNVHSTDQSAELAIDDNTVKVDLTSYFKEEPQDDEYDRAAGPSNDGMTSTVRIKDEPVDSGYERAMSSSSLVHSRELGPNFTRFQIANGTVLQVEPEVRNSACEKVTVESEEDIPTEDWELAEVKLEDVVDEEEEDDDNNDDEWMAFEYDEDEILMETENGYPADEQTTTPDYGDSVLYDPKLHMIPVVEVEDIVKNIMLAKQESDDDVN